MWRVQGAGANCLWDHSLKTETQNQTDARACDCTHRVACLGLVESGPSAEAEMHALSLGAGAPAHNVTSLLCRRRQRSRAGGGFRVHARASSDTTPHVVVIGAGWGGWGAAKALSGAGVRVTLLDAGGRTERVLKLHVEWR